MKKNCPVLVISCAPPRIAAVAVGEPTPALSSELTARAAFTWNGPAHPNRGTSVAYCYPIRIETE